MTNARFLGAAWTAVHGPPDPRAMAIWLLDRGFHGLVAGPTPRPVSWAALRAEQRDLPIRFPAVRAAAFDAGDERADAGLCSRGRGDREKSMAAIAAAVELARVVGTDCVILEPGLVPLVGEAGPLDLGDPAIVWTADRAGAQLARRNARLDAALDAACRALFDLCRAAPGIRFCLTPSRCVNGLGEPAALAAIFEDLARSRVGFWHDTAIAARRQELLGEEQGAWLDRFGSIAAGVTIGDAADGRMNLPPGAGMVDFPLLGSYVRRPGHALPAVVELDAGVDPAELAGIRSFLSKFGL